MASSTANLNTGSSDPSNVATSSTCNVDDFTRVLDRFKAGLKRKEIASFQIVTLEDVQKAIGDIQKKQQSERRMQNMNRLGKVVEGLTEYGKVVEVFCNTSQFVPFIWVGSPALMATFYMAAF